MPKKVTEQEKDNFLNSFVKGQDIKEIAKIYSYSEATITRQLKKVLGVVEFNKIKKKFIKVKTIYKNEEATNIKIDSKNTEQVSKLFDQNNQKDFFEVIPLTVGQDFHKQKDLSSEPINNAHFPEMVYLLVDKKIELKPKPLKEYPEWGYMPEEDLNRLTLEVFGDQKKARKLCGNNQKVIKIPNPNVFLLAANSLKSKGISRIIFESTLLAL